MTVPYILNPLTYASNIGDGTKTVTTAGTAVPLSSTSVPCKVVYITARSTNTGRIMVGGSTVVAAISTSSRGLPLSANDTTPPIIVDDLNKVYIDSTVSGEGVMFMYLS